MLIIVCLVVSLGGSPSQNRVGFEYWSHPGAFKEYLVDGATGRFLGVFACVVQACFAYTGTEVVGVAFGEAPDPRKNVPKAVNQTFMRIGFFYVLGALALGMAVPYNSRELIGATKSKISAGTYHMSSPSGRYLLTFEQARHHLSLRASWERSRCYLMSSMLFCLYSSSAPQTPVSMLRFSHTLGS